ncbi:hypothetical protein [Maricaulis salignorans]|uniref:hypothetical protein n=1 Tax=Maricaulis salignorans TaxID=144026 RepID=UPI000B849201|nr:hypothetical protein [Maricaulis salignorans]
MASAGALESAAERIAGICLSRDHDDDACHCLAREAGSRFDSHQLQRIAEGLEAGDSAPEVTQRLRQAGMSEVELASFTRRLETAQVVIHQTCGTSFFEVETD